MYHNMVALIDIFNRQVAIPMAQKEINRQLVDPKFVSPNYKVEFPCKVAIIGNQTYGKFDLEAVEFTSIMEYKHFIPLIAQYLPEELALNTNFRDFLLKNGTKLIYELADYFVFTLPAPRVNWYQSNDYLSIQKTITGYSNEIIETLGFFNVKIHLEILGALELYSFATMFLGLIFDLILLLFAV